ncbi:MAG: hypothetical protein ACLTYW_09290 [Collinsella sp.]
MAHDEQSPIKCLELSDEKADAVLVEVARRLVGEDRACMLGECEAILARVSSRRSSSPAPLRRR